ncbi:MGDG synthase family glycosyltransferase [Ileibacterium valens]|uniref:Glycosyl transferase n=1 Tax=Ileibacterium valens TaxID=1862668 RepID=A0A1U7NDG8_9FIRM|nr:glycosyltransferase [Ileibacterium valens]OLU37074.1 hypothetical protein BO222_11085 [Ileibacterium valens]OLU38012.1 hypothetical protein BO224_09935 [Erysipelotrichaceae bacterium NYU-BL-E8]OLU41894.1 hypothetical protein BM735_03265 [Erysipelotrichaceae bacterium NYU-BL-F16]
MKPKALLLSCSTGGGHDSCAHAMIKHFEKNGWDTQFLDPYTLDSRKTANLVGGAYVHLIQKYPKVFYGLYKAGEWYEKLENIIPLPSPVLDVQKSTSRRLLDYLRKNPVDLIVCTHMYAGMMITLLKEEGLRLPPSILITTDYACIPFETQADCDYTCIASKDIEDEFLKWHLDPYEVLPLGIPVDPEFEKTVNRKEIRKKLELPVDKTLLLLGSGSMGFSSITKDFEDLEAFLEGHKDVNLLVMCGHSDDLYLQLLQEGHEQIKPIPFVDNVYDYVHACDVYLTKPGGLSITEAAAAGTPLMLVSPIPGVESANAEYFERKNMAFYARKPEEIIPFLEQLLNPQIARAMVMAQKHTLPRHSGQAVVDFASALVHLSPTKKKPGIHPLKTRRQNLT